MKCSLWFPESALKARWPFSLLAIRRRWRGQSRGRYQFLTEVAGIGTKTAKKISVELKDKVAGLSFELGEDAYASSDAEAIEVLTTLGWSNKEAREALQRVPREIISAEQRVKEAMKLLGR